MKQQNTNFEHGLLVNLPANTTLIIPDGTTLDSEDVEFRLFNNSSLLLLGNLSNSKRVDKYPWLSFTTKTYNIYDLSGKRANNQNIIIGPNATYDMVKKVLIHRLIYQIIQILFYILVVKLIIVQ